jgi:ATP-dependent RNA helicase RhlE
MSTFAELGLAPEILNAVLAKGYTVPTPIQAKAIPPAMEGRDLLGAAQTGTGKTAGFSLPLLHRLSAQKAPLLRGRAPRALVMTPTRELAAQIEDNVRTYGAATGLKSTVIFGGVGMGNQVNALRNGIDILIATPGRLLDHLGQRTVDLSKVEILVLDEADRMLDMGFLPSIKRVLAALPRQRRQTMLFSATFAPEIRELAKQFLRDPVEVQVAPQNSTAALIEHRVHPVDLDRKKDLLIELLRKDSRVQSLIFTRTKHGADKLVKALDAIGFKAAAIHGNKSQGARTRALADFKSGAITLLVATDIAARGLDIKELPMVYNFDLPMVAEDYVHRIGRTGRAGSTGLAISLVAPEDHGLLRDIRNLTKRDLELETVEGFESHGKPIFTKPQMRQPRGPRQHQGHRGAPSRGQGQGEQTRADQPRRSQSPRDGARPAHAPTGNRSNPDRSSSPDRSGQNRSGPRPGAARPASGANPRPSQARPQARQHSAAGNRRAG